MPKRSKKCHEQFRLGMGESSDKSSAENEAPKSKPPKKLKLTVSKENRWQFVDDATEALA